MKNIIILISSKHSRRGSGNRFQVPVIGARTYIINYFFFSYYLNTFWSSNGGLTYKQIRKITMQTRILLKMPLICAFTLDV